MAPSWLAWCSFSLSASNKLHFSTTFRLGCGGGLILAGEGVPDEISTTGGTSMGSGPGCVQGPEGFPGSPGLVPLGRPASPWCHIESLPGPHDSSSGPACWLPQAVFDAEEPLKCDPCRLPTASHDANLASWRGDLAASLALSGSRFAVRSWSGCSQILMLSQKSSNSTPRSDLAKFGSGSVLAPPL